MLMWPLDRRSTEALVLATLSIFAVGCLRFPVELRSMFLIEMALIVGFAVSEAAAKIRLRWGSMGLVATPAVVAAVARVVGVSIAFEMTALTSLGTLALAMAIRGERTRAMSLVSSGFLTLFSVAISDDQNAVYIAIVWIAICMWHLVANHWERLELRAVENVRRSVGVRPMSVLMAVLLCILGGVVVRDRFAPPQRFEFGFMPASGGSKWSDPAARSGVATGDAAIAAKDHAESFGAVESDLFLESTESTLFDMFNDSIGEPKKKNKSERRQGLNNENVIEAHQKTAKSEKGGSTFSTDRMPAKKHLHLNDSAENAVVQWAGPTGIRLAMNRYDTFDGVQWSNAATHRNEQLVRAEINGAAWFFDPVMLPAQDRSASPVPSARSTSVGLLKVLRLKSTRIPAPMMTSGLHIKDVDRQDFFGIEDDGSFYMPGRDQVPALTVVNIASTKLMEDELWERLPSSQSYIAMDARIDQEKRNENELAAKSLSICATKWTEGCDHVYEKLQAIVSNLRDDFEFDRGYAPESDDPVAEFLRTRRGGDHLFATTAALLARELGLQSRLVTGFYVRPAAIDVSAGHTNVLPQDVHVWAEIRLDDGRWFEIEPTPGYAQPNYRPSPWLMTKQFAAANWPIGVGLLLVAVALLVTRMVWIELGLGIFYRIGTALCPRHRIAIAMGVLQTRARLAGCPRSSGIPQRDWLLAMTQSHESVREPVRRFCDAADRAVFAESGHSFIDPSLVQEMLMRLKIKSLRQLTVEEVS